MVLDNPGTKGSLYQLDGGRGSLFIFLLLFGFILDSTFY